MVTSDIAGNTTWRAENNYLLVGFVRVLPGVTLTIDAGTAIRGARGFTSALIVTPGAEIIAEGTREQPIIFTSDADFTAGQQQVGDWVGLVILGNAVANCGIAVPGCSETSGVNPCDAAGGLGTFGGPDDDDSSGVLRYVRVEYSGREISPQNAVDAFSLRAVGHGAILEFLQSHVTVDDGVSFDGGTARVKHVVVTGCFDDAIDWQFGYRGRIQFAVVPQIAGGGADRGLEADNNEFEQGVRAAFQRHRLEPDGPRCCRRRRGHRSAARHLRDHHQLDRYRVAGIRPARPERGDLRLLPGCRSGTGLPGDGGRSPDDGAFAVATQRARRITRAGFLPSRVSARVSGN